MFIADLRLIIPYLDKFSLTRETLFWKLYEGSFFHWLRIFNATLITIKHRLPDIRNSQDLPVLEAFQKDIGDVYTFGFQPPFLPSNVTTLGSVESTHECFLISFPTLKTKSVSVDGLKFIWLNSDHQTILALAIIFIAIMIISMLAEKGSFLRIYWHIHWATLAHQERIRASRGLTRTLWLSLLVLLFLIESITIACMNTDHVSEYQFGKIENFGDVLRKNLKPVMEDHSGCTQIISSQVENVRAYLRRNRYPRNNHHFMDVDLVFSPTFMEFRLKEMALLIDVDRWIQIKRQTCYLHPHILIENSFYRSCKPLLNQINSLFVNGRLNKKIRDALNRESSVLLEASLHGRRGWLAHRRRENIPVDRKCMGEVLKEKEIENSPLEFSFIRSAFLTWIFALITAWIIFLIEILIQTSLNDEWAGRENFTFSQRLITNNIVSLINSYRVK